MEPPRSNGGLPMEVLTGAYACRSPWFLLTLLLAYLLSVYVSQVYPLPAVTLWEDSQPVLRRCVQQLFKKSSAGKTVRLITIGANTLKEDAERYLDYSRFHPQSVFVEPIPIIIPELRETAERFLGKGSVTIFNAAVCDRDEQQVNFNVQWHKGGYDETRRQFGVGSTLIDGIATGMQQEWGVIYNRTVIPVRCITPATLLNESSWEASSLDILHTDAEGYDLKILPKFMELPNFSPAIMSFEIYPGWAPDTAEIGLLLENLLTVRKGGYTYHWDGHDIWAIATDCSLS